jgi:hypothetical protein
MGKSDMSTGHNKQRLSYIILCVGLVLVTVVFGIRAKYAPAVHYMLAVIQFTVIGLAAWQLGLWAIRAQMEERRKLAVAGGLLILPFALFSLLAGIGPPGMGQTHAEEQVRYLILLINAIATAGGLVILREALSAAGERFYSTLGFAAILLAAPLYLIWATILLGAHSSKALASSGQAPPWASFLYEISDILLFFGGILTYIATAAFAASLRRTQWLGRKATLTFVTASFFAVLCLAIRGLQFPDPTAVFRHWYDIPGFVVGIPAAPWIMLCLFGVVLLRRAGNE